MNLKKITEILDKEFFETKVKEDLVSWAVTKDNQNYINKPFLNQETGLMLHSGEVINEVFTCVFVTGEIIDKVCINKNSLLVTHHNFNYYEDERGLCPIRFEQLERLKNSGISLYVAHAGLDTHKIYGTSKVLAETLNIEIEGYFFDYFGDSVALVGMIEKDNYDNYIEFVKRKLDRNLLTIEKYTDEIRKIAVVAGGGDEPEILKEAYKLGADTMIGGTIEHKWGLPFIQENNKKFRDLNKELKLNLIGGTHYGTERPAMQRLVEFFEKLNLKSTFIEDESLLKAK